MGWFNHQLEAQAAKLKLPCKSGASRKKKNDTRRQQGIQDTGNLKDTKTPEDERLEAESFHPLEFRKIMFQTIIFRFELLIFGGVKDIYLGTTPPPPSNSHHQGYSIFSRESQPKPSQTPLLVGRGYPQHILLIQMPPLPRKIATISCGNPGLHLEKTFAA